MTIAFALFCSALRRQLPFLSALAMFTCLLALACAPLILLSCWLDPYRVFRDVPSPYVSDWEPNTRYLKTAFLDRHAEAAHRPDAFLFGASDAGAFSVDDLARAIDPELRFYNYFVSVESLRGIRLKLEFLLRRGYSIRAVIVVLPLPLSTPNSFLRREHYRVSGEPRALFEAYYATMLFQGFEEAMLRLMRRAVAPRHSPRVEYRIDTGEVVRVDQEAALASDPERYYREVEPALLRDALRRGAMARSWGLDAEAQRELIRIRDVLHAHGCRRIILLLAPSHVPSTPDKEALTFLNGSFDEVWDLASDRGLPMDYHQYYDPTHFRPSLARWMLSRRRQ